MLKKIIITIAILIGVASIALNYFLIDSVLLDYLDENDRLKESYQMISLFGFPTHQYSDLNGIYSKEDPVIQLMDTTIRNMITISGELTDASGGVNRYGQYINPHGLNYVETYFNRRNNSSSNAIEFFNKNILTYTSKMDSLGLDSHLVKVVSIKNKHFDRPFVQGFTVAESSILIESICYHILIDKYNYLIELKN